VSLPTPGHPRTKGANWGLRIRCEPSRLWTGCSGGHSTADSRFGSKLANDRLAASPPSSAADAPETLRRIEYREFDLSYQSHVQFPVDFPQEKNRDEPSSDEAILMVSLLPSFKTRESNFLGSHRPSSIHLQPHFATAPDARQSPRQSFKSQANCVRHRATSFWIRNSRVTNRNGFHQAITASRTPDSADDRDVGPRPTPVGRRCSSTFSP